MVSTPAAVTRTTIADLAIAKGKRALYWALPARGAAYAALQNRVLGALAQLGERYNGIVEVSGSIPLGSTIQTKRVPDTPAG